VFVLAKQVADNLLILAQDVDWNLTVLCFVQGCCSAKLVVVNAKARARCSTAEEAHCCSRLVEAYSRWMCCMCYATGA
jgi:hypothetical protein